MTELADPFAGWVPPPQFSEPAFTRDRAIAQRAIDRWFFNVYAMEQSAAWNKPIRVSTDPVEVPCLVQWPQMRK